MLCSATTLILPPGAMDAEPQLEKRRLLAAMAGVVLFLVLLPWCLAILASGSQNPSSITGSDPYGEKVFLDTLCDSAGRTGRPHVVAGHLRGNGDNTVRQGFPRPEASLWLDRAYYQAVEGWFQESLPAGQPLKCFHNWLNYHLFSATSTAGVHIGIHGWLYPGESQRRPFGRPSPGRRAVGCCWIFTPLRK
jgi:hypothetical protein